jgi:hypothetical protein
MVSRRRFIENGVLLGSALALWSFKPRALTFPGDEFDVPEDLQKEMYNKALALARLKIRGGSDHPVFKNPFLDAAFSESIFYWDTCFIATYAKYHQDELPIANALDNFYDRMDTDGYICREFRPDGTPFWPKNHPVSMNPPLLAFAELELFSIKNDEKRLAKVYPFLKKHFQYWIETYQCPDKLFFSDAFGSGMDNIERYPYGWQDDKQGIPLINLHPEIFLYDYLSSKWNKQGRSVDASAQMCLFADNMAAIAKIINQNADIIYYTSFHKEVSTAINQHCWNKEDGFYYDLGYGKQIKRKHIGMFWTLLGGVVPENKLDKFLAHLTNPGEFRTRIPVASFSADQPEYNPKGGYWLGSIWAPTNYMILRGLSRYGKNDLAREIAEQYYWAVAEVYKKTGTFWENYAPAEISQGSQAAKDFCGWTALVPISVLKEYIAK